MARPCTFATSTYCGASADWTWNICTEEPPTVMPLLRASASCLVWLVFESYMTNIVVEVAAEVHLGSALCTDDCAVEWKSRRERRATWNHVLDIVQICETAPSQQQDCSFATQPKEIIIERSIPKTNTFLSGEQIRKVLAWWVAWLLEVSVQKSPNNNNDRKPEATSRQNGHAHVAL